MAEVLSEHGYDTVGVSENPWITPTFNMSQGFARFEHTGLRTTVPRALRGWLAERDASRPFFAFVNVVDAHAPYTVRDRNPHTPGPVSREEAQAIPQDKRHYLCRASEHEHAVAVLHGLYLRDVTAADEKLAVILELVRSAIGDRDLVTIVTSDHGEHFGEHEMVDHVGGLRNELLHVPLVVHGLPGVAPAVVHEPVQLTALAPTVLALAGVEPGPLMTTPVLPYADVSEEPGALVAEFYDPTGPHEPDAAHALLGLRTAVSRRRCDRARDRLFGRMQSLIDFPYKLVWYEEYPVELFDLRTDPHERRNLALQRPELTARLLATLRERTDDSGAPTGRAGAAVPPPTIDDDVRQRLRTLGYLPDEEPAGTGP